MDCGASRPRKTSPNSLTCSVKDRWHWPFPRVIRPDLILTEGGYIIAELDNVPGGIGLTAWLDQIYSDNGAKILGGTEGMLDGFASILPGGDIVVSEEAATYRPEMEWLARATQRVASDTWPLAGRRCTSRATIGNPEVYRFFELYDLANVPCARQLCEKELRG